MKSEFTLAFNELLEDKGLPKDIILKAIEDALVSAYRRSVNASSAQHIEAHIDLESGKVTILAEKEVVEDVQDERTEVSLEEARKIDPDVELGSLIIVESTPKNFGRVAAQTARQVIQQRIREAERKVQYDYYKQQEGEIISGVIQAISPQHVTLGLELKAEGIMPRKEQIPREHFRVHDRIRALLLEVRESPRGPQIILSRAHKDFLRRLLENEVPEIYHGMVEIRSISREPGFRSKVAVAALQPGIDPVGACVGMRGVRIQAIVRELNDEKIDVIEWNPDPSIFIAKALSPARVTGVYPNEPGKGPKTATVVVPEDQLSLAIGRDGQNARLAAKLTSWRIDIKSLPEAASEILYKFETDPEYAEIALEETAVAEQVSLSLAKKAEGRPVTPEEYQIMANFVDRVMKTILEKKNIIRKQKEDKIAKIKQDIPDAAFELPLDVLGLSERVSKLLTEEGYESVGDIMLQLKLDPDEILAINGFGPKAMQELEKAIELLELPTAEAIEEEQPVAEELAIEETEAKEEQPAEEKVMEATPETEVIAEPQTEPEIVSEVEAAPSINESEDEIAEIEEQSLEDIFKLKPEMLDIEELEFDVEDFESEDEEEEIKKVTKKKKKKKKKPKRFVEAEYDPEQDATVYLKKHKRDSDDWDDDWDF